MEPFLVPGERFLYGSLSNRGTTVVRRQHVPIRGP